MMYIMMAGRLCAYKDALGAPGTGFHETRLLGMAAWDLLGTLVIAWLISRIAKMNVIVVFVMLMLLAEMTHYAFCVDTAVMKCLFG